MSSMNFSLKRNIMTLALYFGYQNSRAIHTEKGILPIFGQMNFSRIKTRIKIIQKVIRIFQYPYCVEATT
jgi:hypothetical protein